MPARVDQPLQERVERDAERVRSEYARRAADARLHRYYARVQAALARQQEDRRARVVEALDQLGARQSLRILDAGCGTGADLADLAVRGFAPGNLVGLDILASELALAHERTAGAHFVLGNAAVMPFPDASFDGVTLITVFSSIVDDEVRAQAAREAARVVRPNGRIISYDFRVVGDGNPHLVPVDEAEVMRLLGGFGPTTMLHHGLSLRIASRVPRQFGDLLSNFSPLLHFILAITRVHASESVAHA